MFTPEEFRRIGFEGTGSPLCIEEENGRVVILDHGHSFVVQVVNTSISQLAESLLVYREFLAA